MFNTIPFAELDIAGKNAPVHALTPQTPVLSDAEGASRYRFQYESGPFLDALFLKKSVDTLVVTFHGALHRSKYELPRFEWLSTLKGRNFSSLYFCDPTLWLDDTIQLGWFAGWPGVDIQRDIANIIIAAAHAASATRVILLGSSGGGFAALQVSALVPGSLCLPFNPTTHIHKYWVNGDPTLHGTERKLIEVAYPQAAPEGIRRIDWDHDWTVAEGDHLSVLRRYSKPVGNYVLFASNPNEWHYDQHYLPFLAAAATGDNLQRVRVWEYEGRELHAPPRPDEFNGGLAAALDWDTPPFSV